MWYRGRNGFISQIWNDWYDGDHYISCLKSVHWLLMPKLIFAKVILIVVRVIYVVYFAAWYYVWIGRKLLIFFSDFLVMSLIYWNNPPLVDQAPLSNRPLEVKGLKQILDSSVKNVNVEASSSLSPSQILSMALLDSCQIANPSGHWHPHRHTLRQRHLNWDTFVTWNTSQFQE